LLFTCSRDESGKRPFIVVLGYYCGQKEDVVTKDLVEPVAERSRGSVTEAILAQTSSQYPEAPIYFL
jgi:hypothetical protein